MNVWQNARFELVDPTTLLTDRNSRTITDIKAEKPVLYQSIEDHGVQIPVIANPTDQDGVYRVRTGHSRTMIGSAFVDKYPKIPVLVTDSIDTAVWQLLRDQWIENEIRTGYTEADKSKLIAQMALELDPDQIATALTTNVATVQAGLAVHRSTKTIAVSERFPQLDMFELAAMAEFDGDPEAYQRLVDTLANDPDQFDNVATRLRSDRDERARVAEAQESLRQAGITLVDSDDLPSAALPLERLYASAEDLTVLTADMHSECPGRGAYIRTNYRREVKVTPVCLDFAEHGHRDTHVAAVEDAAAELTAAGVIVVDAGLPDTTRRLTSLQASADDDTLLTEQTHGECPGHAAYVTVNYRGEAAATYVCVDFAAHGHRALSSGSSPRPAPSPEYAKAQRRRVIANNKAWHDRIGKRRSWLGHLAAMKALPAGVSPKKLQQLSIAARFAGRDYLSTAMSQGNKYAMELLKFTPNRSGDHPIHAKLKNATEARATIIDLVMTLAGFEEHYNLKHTKDRWRTPTADDKVYFRTLLELTKELKKCKKLPKDLTYAFASVEQLVLDPAADAQDWPSLRPAFSNDPQPQSDSETDDDDQDPEQEPDDDGDATDDLEADKEGAEPDDEPTEIGDELVSAA